ncbi:MAG: sulfate adenylyltransferase subunit CysN [Gammaproteobacteria bacterium]|jgi:bifunctional enzyme CysN/CysC|nr:sulfate adenylyltransferase subunit CysN [Gammaproteobacteria bacterium]
MTTPRTGDLLRFITCGSVDDGKSTLIGRLLFESQQIPEDQIAALKRDSRRFGTQGDAIDFALLVDGLAAEREQGITIDVAYRFFSSQRRSFIVADTPGHEQYTRNMVTGASTADLAVLLVNARTGLTVQTRRHAYLVSLMGLRHVVLAINKLDLIAYDQQVCRAIESDFARYAAKLGFETIVAIPMSALRGDNVTTQSTAMPWYTGPSLLEYLETIDTRRLPQRGSVFPVQWVNRPTADFRGYAGTLAAGELKLGDSLRVAQSGQLANITRIVTGDGDRSAAIAGDAITLCLDREIDISRGDVLSRADLPVETTDQFEATIIWLHEEPGLASRRYDLKLASQWSGASITAIKHRVNVNTLAEEPARKLDLNDITVCNIATTQSLAFERYSESRELGGFILVDRYTHATVAAGLIRHSLRRAQNVHRQSLSVDRTAREKLNGHPGKVLWFTGLSGSGKSTLANALEVELHARGIHTYILDGDNVRQGLNRDLGFTDTDRVENIRRIAEVAKLMMDAGLIVMTSFISPFRGERDLARELIGPENFVEIFVDTPLEVCEQRDVKGLYKKAREGKIPNMTGVNSPYEAPLAPDVTVRTQETPLAESVRALRKLLESAD